MECNLGLKSYAWFQNWTSAQREFNLKSQVWFQTKIAQHEVQLPLYYIRFEIAIWSVTLNKPWSLIGCFVFSVASSLAGKKMRFKAKNGAIRE